MPDLTAAELSIPAEQHPDPAKPLVRGHLEPPARDSSGGCPGFIYPLGPGTYFRTDHFAQQPSAAAF